VIFELAVGLVVISPVFVVRKFETDQVSRGKRLWLING
jgi:hypothetical protein